MELTPVAVFSEVTPVAVFSAVSGAYVGRLERVAARQMPSAASLCGCRGPPTLTCLQARHAA